MGDYPTDEELEYFKTEKPTKEFLERLEDAWWASDWGVSHGRKYSYISTGGWSGNEDIIYALQQNFFFWSSYWVSSRTGGHYKFRKFGSIEVFNK